MHFITFSRKLGANGTAIARHAAEKLGYRFIDTEAIEKAAQKMGILESVSELDEKVPSLFQRIFSHKPSINLARLNSVINELAQKGDAVFLGRGGHMLLKAFGCGLHVRVVASRKTRIRNLEAQGYGEDLAEKLIEHSDAERSSFMNFAFKVDWEDAGLYDVVLNTDKLSVDSAVDTVLALACSSEINACSLHSLESLGNLALAGRVEAAIIEAGLSYGIETSVLAAVEEPGKVCLSGLVEDKQSKIRAEEVVKKVNGVTAIDNQIRIRPSDRHA